MILSPEDLNRCAEIRDPELGILRVVSAIAEATGLTVNEIRGHRRWPHVVAARHLAFYICHEQGFSARRIARFFNSDRSAVFYGIAKERARRGQ